MGGLARGLKGSEVGLIAAKDAVDTLRIHSEQGQFFTTSVPGFGTGNEIVFGLHGALKEDFVFKLPGALHSEEVDNYCFGKSIFGCADAVGGDESDNGISLGLIIGAGDGTTDVAAVVASGMNGEPDSGRSSPP